MNISVSRDGVVYVVVRHTPVFETKEVSVGTVYADYDVDGDLRGIEVLSLGTYAEVPDRIMTDRRARRVLFRAAAFLCAMILAALLPFIVGGCVLRNGSQVESPEVNMKPMKQLQSGLVVPEEKPTKPPRIYGPLEFEREADRADISRAIMILVSRTQKYRISSDDPAKQEQRRAVVDMMIRLFLGDVEFEERT